MTRLIRVLSLITILLFVGALNLEIAKTGTPLTPLFSLSTLFAPKLTVYAL